MDKRVVFDFEIEFSNGGGIQGQDFRLDIEDGEIPDEALADHIIQDMRLLMVDKVRILNKYYLKEKHKRSPKNLEGKQITAREALKKLGSKNEPFITLFEHGTLSVEIYKPDQIDKQQPHEQDEVYVVIAGKGTFLNAGKRTPFQPGDFLFVKAGVEHRFENFTDDFSTWVIFYGPKGGEED